MAISRDEFNTAFRQVASAEFAHVPANEKSIDYIFSPDFERRMERLIHRQKKPYYRFVNTAAKRVAVIFLLCAVLLASACSVKAIREPIIEFVTEIYEAFTRIFWEGDTTGVIQQEYVITALPEGFYQTDELKSEIFNQYTYENGRGNFIEFSQFATAKAQYNVDTEYTTETVEMIAGKEVHLYTNEDRCVMLWTEAGYVFQLCFDRSLDMDIIIAVMESVQ